MSVRGNPRTGTYAVRGPYFWFDPPPSPVKPPLYFVGILAGGEVVKGKILAKLFHPF